MQNFQVRPAEAAPPSGARPAAVERDGSQMSMIGADITITGNIEATVDLHIEGRVLGDVRCATLILGESSTISGTIHAERVRVSGTVDGAIATRDLAVEATARVTGDIAYERMRVANGAIVDGTLKRNAPAEGAADSKLKLVEAQAQPNIATPQAKVETPPEPKAEPQQVIIIE